MLHKALPTRQYFCFCTRYSHIHQRGLASLRRYGARARPAHAYPGLRYAQKPFAWKQQHDTRASRRSCTASHTSSPHCYTNAFPQCHIS